MEVRSAPEASTRAAGLPTYPILSRRQHDEPHRRRVDHRSGRRVVHRCPRPLDAEGLDARPRDVACGDDQDRGSCRGSVLGVEGHERLEEAGCHARVSSSLPVMPRRGASAGADAEVGTRADCRPRSGFTTTTLPAPSSWSRERRSQMPRETFSVDSRCAGSHLGDYPTLDTNPALRPRSSTLPAPSPRSSWVTSSRCPRTWTRSRGVYPWESGLPSARQFTPSLSRFASMIDAVTVLASTSLP